MATSLRHLLLLVALSVSVRPLAATVALEKACRRTQHPAYCVKALSAKPESRTADLPALAEIALSLAAEKNGEAVSYVENLEKMPGATPLFCLEDCDGKFQAALAELRRSKAALECKEVVDVREWVSAAMADVNGCTEDCRKVEGGADPAIVGKVDELRKLFSITLDLTNPSTQSS